MLLAGKESHGEFILAFPRRLSCQACWYFSRYRPPSITISYFTRKKVEHRGAGMFSLDFNILGVHTTRNERLSLQLNLISFLQYSSTESQKVAVILHFRTKVKYFMWHFRIRLPSIKLVLLEFNTNIYNLILNGIVSRN